MIVKTGCGTDGAHPHVVAQPGHRGQGQAQYKTGHLNFWTMAPLQTLPPLYLQSPWSCHI